MDRKFLAGIAGLALILSIHPSAIAATVPLRDFDPLTLAAYVDFRFSSAVPPSVIRAVLAGEGFSQRDLDLIMATGPPLERPPTASGGPGITNVKQISRDPLSCPGTDPNCELDTEAEPSIAVNPQSTGNIVAVFQQGRYNNGGAVDNGWATSFDDGKKWPYRGSAPGLTVGVTGTPSSGHGAPFERASDPAVSFDTKNKSVLLNSAAVSVRGCAIYCDSAVTVNVSHDNGRTFGPPVVVQEDIGDPNSATGAWNFNDKNWITTDNFPSSPYYGRSYAVWDQVQCKDPSCTGEAQPVMLKYSDDGGKSWSSLIQATNQQPFQSHLEIGVQPVVLPNGDVVIVFADAAAGVFTFFGQFQAIRSTNGGRTWSLPVTIAPANPFAEEANGLRAPNVPMAAVDTSGTLYVAFQDQGPTATGRNDIWLTSSSDEGQHWSPPVNATLDEIGLDHFSPAIAAVGGTVHLVYRSHSPASVKADPKVDTAYRALRGGITVRGPATLGPPSDVSVGAFTTTAGQNFAFLGDYDGMVASSLSAHPVWDQAQAFSDQHDNPTHTHQRTFSARIQ